MEKKFKAQDKLKKRQERKNSPGTTPVDPPIDPEEISDEERAI